MCFGAGCGLDSEKNFQTEMGVTGRTEAAGQDRGQGGGDSEDLSFSQYPPPFYRLLGYHGNVREGPRSWEFGPLPEREMEPELVLGALNEF